MSLPEDVKARYIAIIDGILATSDLNTISEKRIRKGLQAALDYDITPQKPLIKDLIMLRFDDFNARHNAPSAAASQSPVKTEVNGHSNGVVQHVDNSRPSMPTPPPMKRKALVKDEEDMSDMLDGSPKSSKKAKQSGGADDDAIFAARLQAEENSRARPTRGGAVKKVGPVKKKKAAAAKRRSAAVVSGDSSNDSDSTSKKRKVNRTGGFHKPLMLSPALSEFVGGETMLPRTEVVKRIWAYVKERDLQDPNDKRQIRCDAALKAVFRQDRVHMFTMNKLLTSHVFAADE
ncbi:MAG: hypothetical protein M1817_001793 [Caeruleum heppii]|nr:MAG: hypothetical protein M1817_001793 [Caeruleum heppii]